MRMITRNCGKAIRINDDIYIVMLEHQEAGAFSSASSRCARWRRFARRRESSARFRACRPSAPQQEGLWQNAKG